MTYQVINVTENRIVSEEGCYGNACELQMVLGEMHPDCEFKIVEVGAA